VSRRGATPPAKEARGWAEAATILARPYLTVVITTIYNVTLLIALVMNKLEVKEYIMAIGPVNAMVMGFWFGERAALKNPENKE
jgi:hypothetical protein